MSSIKRNVWNKLKGNNPFLEYDWLNTMERSLCVCAETGWDPIHIVVGYRTSSSNETSELNALAACPLYVKYHSYGEFIFDHEWASFAQDQLGIKYYPKVS
jgi:predicted N-acyltransferase